MVRILLITALIVYILSKVSGLFRASATQQNKNSQQPKPKGNIRVDSIPKKDKRGEIKGGDYVDYEEVK